MSARGGVDAGCVRCAKPEVDLDEVEDHTRTKESHAIYKHPDGRAAVIPQHGTIKRGTLSSIIR